MEAALGGMGIPSALSAMLLEDLGQTVGVIGQVIKGHGAIFNE